jgi:hypothetical protein
MVTLKTMRHLILTVALALSGCSSVTSSPLFRTLIWNPDACTFCDTQPLPAQPAAQPYNVQQEMDAAQLSAAIRQQQIRESQEQWQQRWAPSRQQPPAYDPTFPVSGGLSTFRRGYGTPQQQPPSADPSIPVSGGLSTFEP